MSHETALIGGSIYFKALACDHFRKIKKNAYPVIKSNAVNALDDAERMIAAEVVKPDVVFFDMPEGNTTLQDIELSAREMRIGDNRLCLHTLSDAEDLPGKVATDTRYEKLSTDRSDCRLSFASPVGLLLSCNHIYNQYVLIDNSEETLQKFEKSARNMAGGIAGATAGNAVGRVGKLLK